MSKKEKRVDLIFATWTKCTERRMRDVPEECEKNISFQLPVIRSVLFYDRLFELASFARPDGTQLNNVESLC